MGSTRHRMQFWKPTTKEEAEAFVKDRKYFGYHPAGYGGDLYLPNKEDESLDCNLCDGTGVNKWTNKSCACFLDELDKSKGSDHPGKRVVASLTPAYDLPKSYSSEVWYWVHADSCS